MRMNPVTRSGNAVVIALRVIPRASKNAVAGVMGDAVKVRVCAPPVDGKANAAVAELLAEALGAKRSQVAIVAGGTGRRKLGRGEGIDEGEARRKLGIRGER